MVNSNKIAKFPHPTDPEVWLDGAAASRLLGAAHLPSSLSLARCKRDGIEVCASGHISRASLEQFIGKREKS